MLREHIYTPLPINTTIGEYPSLYGEEVYRGMCFRRHIKDFMKLQLPLVIIFSILQIYNSSADTVLQKFEGILLIVRAEPIIRYIWLMYCLFMFICAFAWARLYQSRSESYWIVENGQDCFPRIHWFRCRLANWWNEFNDNKQEDPLLSLYDSSAILGSHATHAFDQFVHIPNPWEENRTFVTPSVVTSIQKHRRAALIWITFLILLGIQVLANWQITLQHNGEEEGYENWNYIVISILLVCCNFLCRQMAPFLTRLEEYKSATSYENALILKAYALNLCSILVPTFLAHMRYRGMLVYGSRNIMSSLVASALIGNLLDVLACSLQLCFFGRCWRNQQINNYTGQASVFRPSFNTINEYSRCGEIMFLSMLLLPLSMTAPWIGFLALWISEWCARIRLCRLTCAPMRTGCRFQKHSLVILYTSIAFAFFFFPTGLPWCISSMFRTDAEFCRV